MHFIEHIIDPRRLLLAWQPLNENDRTRYIVAELNRVDNEINLKYFPNSPDFITAQKHGFNLYPAFLETNETHNNVLNTFMRRLPPRSRGDFQKYLENHRLKPDVKISDFALLGYTGAKLLSDGFSIIHPFDHTNNGCEFLLEVPVVDSLKKNISNIALNDMVTFKEEVHEPTQENAIQVVCHNNIIGHINRGIIPAFQSWIKNKKIKSALIEKINGTAEQPTVYIFVTIE